MEPFRGKNVVITGGSAGIGLCLARELAAEWGPEGVRANVLLPGDIQTDMFAMECKGSAMLEGVSEEQFVQRSAETTPVRRVGAPQDVADLTAFLCSDRASFLTGLAIPVTGGKDLPFR